MGGLVIVVRVLVFSSFGFGLFIQSIQYIQSIQFVKRAGKGAPVFENRSSVSSGEEFDEAVMGKGDCRQTCYYGQAGQDTGAANAAVKSRGRKGSGEHKSGILH